MAIREILLLGDERLYRKCREIGQEEFQLAERVLTDLRDTMGAFRSRYGFGRAIAAPQIDEPVRIIYMNLGGDETLFINPVLEPVGDETFELWDDCMSFPGLEVWLSRWSKCRIRYKDMNWNDCVFEPEGDLSELLQHEYDHLDGILAVQRAKDLKGFRVNREKAGCY